MDKKLRGWGSTYLGPIIAEDPHDADRNCFVQTTS